MPANHTAAFTYRNGMTILGIAEPHKPEDFISDQFTGLDFYSSFLDGSVQLNAQAAIRRCMQRGQSFQDIVEEMGEETRDYARDHIINCNIAYALSIPAPDWNALYRYSRVITRDYDNEFLDFNYMLREVCRINLANTYAVILDVEDSNRADLLKDLAFGDVDVMRLALLFDDEDTVHQLTQRAKSQLVVRAAIDRNLALFKFDPFSKVRVAMGVSDGVSMGELFERTTNQILAIAKSREGVSKFFDKNAIQQYRIAPEHLPVTVKCPTSGVTYRKPNTGLLRTEDLAIDGVDKKLHQYPQFPRFLAHFKHEISELIAATVGAERDPIDPEFNRILASIAKAMVQQGMSIQHYFMKHCASLSPGEILDILDRDAFTRPQYLGALLKHNGSENPQIVNKSSFLILAESVEAFKSLDLNDDQLKTLYKHFPDKAFLEKMSDQSVEHQLGVELGL
ncbi:hypothetical protein DV532_26260 (plasmid) [Pseudomonas sp. Leaf58]|uniref:hypothetical protein n=1 Tax=Pseudomonas sp. Leaf58 TaxID=1736226 RepID=UPI0006FEBE96|nr:hypothetical protein [Pseudomonas sp. Leaf58]AYG47792.1 hypothetical protein DV532_26260 [Pseudomonas sp. Leaf58]KQN62644.1 hypothetical protein ASF02_10885 [Pseudomonas sp. Leaf58]